MASEATLTQEQQRFLDNNVLALEGKVIDSMAAYVETAVQQLQSRGSPPITIFLTSSGGEEVPGIRIMRAFEKYSGHKTVRVAKIAASAGIMVLLSGDLRLSQPDATFLVHEGTHLLPGRKLRDPFALKTTVENHINNHRLFVNFYCERTGMSHEDMQTLMDEDRWMDADEAKSIGLIHDFF